MIARIWRGRVPVAKADTCHGARAARAPLGRARRKMSIVGSLATACTVAAVFPCEASAAQEPAPLVLVLAGQSNMVGQARTAELGAGAARFPANVRLFEDSVEADPAAGAQLGPEITLGQELGRAFPEREVWLVKYARGGTSLLAWAPVWDSTRAAVTGNAGVGPLYAQLLEHLRALDLPASSELAAVLWMQGERDARIPEAGNEYFENLSALIAALRRDLGAPNLPFVMGRVNPPPETYPARATVRDAQRRAAREIPAVYVVETDDLTKWDDRLHYDTRGILELGRRFARAVLEIRQREAGGPRSGSAGGEQTRIRSRASP